MYKYTLSGKLISKLFEDESDNMIVAPEQRFPVIVESGGLAKHCGIEGEMILLMTNQAISFEDPKTQQNRYLFQRKWIRRFRTLDQLFSFECGRRCPNGEGTVTCISPRAAEIYNMRKSPLVNQIWKCALSHTGNKIYIIKGPKISCSPWLGMDHSLPPILTLHYETYRGVYVTPADQVLVCGGDPGTILQIDSDGLSKLAILATPKNGVGNPASLCYNNKTVSIIVGQHMNNNIIVFKVFG